jgi:signal transduction histidine kinase
MSIAAALDGKLTKNSHVLPQAGIALVITSVYFEYGAVGWPWRTGLAPRSINHIKSMNQPAENPGFARPAFRGTADLAQWLVNFLDFTVPVDCAEDPELVRQVKLISRFGTLGALFGVLAAVIYLLIGHVSGAVIVIVCSSCFAGAPFLIRGKQSIEPAGHLLILILTLGFTALCFAEGGLQGHAIAWLVSVPLCALFLLGQKAATRWALITLFAAGAAVTMDLMGIRLAGHTDVKWNPILSAAGHLGLLVFMFVLGLMFEAGRARTFAKMQATIAELALSNEKLRHLDKEKNEFLGIAAHDLRNPLMVILGSAETVAELHNQPEINKLMGNISGAAIHMRDLVTDLLDINSIEQGRVAYRLGPCDLSNLVARAVKNNQALAAKKRIYISVESACDLWARANPAATRQILDNLISNAIKFSSPLTTVYVSALAEMAYVVVIIRDEGPGILAAEQTRLFQKYSRLSPRPTGGESSTGLGLAIVKRLTDAMSGTIDCESTPGIGSSFTLKLPVCPPGK